MEAIFVAILCQKIFRKHTIIPVVCFISDLIIHSFGICACDDLQRSCGICWNPVMDIEVFQSARGAVLYLINVILNRLSRRCGIWSFFLNGQVQRNAAVQHFKSDDIAVVPDFCQKCFIIQSVISWCRYFFDGVDTYRQTF